MPEFTRHAVYYAPPNGSDLARFGASWLGWDAQTARRAAHPDCALDVARLTATPRKYGFHGTLTSPLRLKSGASPDQLSAAARAIAMTAVPFETAPLRLKRIGSFLALVPSAPSDDLNALHASLVRGLFGFRAAPGEAELQKRRANGLSDRQEKLMRDWGYPYVLDEFRFHLTLSGRLESDESGEAEKILTPLTAPFCQGPFAVTEIALFGERASDGQFQIIERYPLTG
ncbi:MAG: DUF1045 domain-containing protein [Pseudomonadota bacterium]